MARFVVYRKIGGRAPGVLDAPDLLAANARALVLYPNNVKQVRSYLDDQLAEEEQSILGRNARLHIDDQDAEP